MPKVLRFNEMSDYVAYLKKQGSTITHLEIKSKTGKPRKLGIAAVWFYAVATCSIGVNDWITYWDALLLETTTLHLLDEQRREQADPSTPNAIRSKILERFEQIKAELERHGLVVERGEWMIEMP